MKKQPCGLLDNAWYSLLLIAGHGIHGALCQLLHRLLS
jgi:hypothetical protein